MTFLNKNDLYNYYVVQNHSRKDTASYFGVTMGVLKYNLSVFDIRKVRTNEKNALDRFNSIREDLI